MTARYRILLECYNDESVTEEKGQQTILLDDVLTPPSNCLNVGMGFTRQLELIQAAQDKILMEEMALLKSGLEQCPDCSRKLYKHGTQYSTFSDVLTDNKVSIQRLKCNACGYESPSTIRTLLDTTQSGELKKIQASLGATYTYRESEEILKLFALKE